MYTYKNETHNIMAEKKKKLAKRTLKNKKILQKAKVVLMCSERVISSYSTCDSHTVIHE